jgi:hypothetical protein
LVEKADDFLIFPYSRLMVDVEIFFDDDKESMAKKDLLGFMKKFFLEMI